MKKAYKVAGLDCAHCALALENCIKKVKGVSSCSVNFITQKIYIEIDDESVLDAVKASSKTTSFEIIGL